MTKIDEIEGKIKTLIDTLSALRKENQTLHSELDSLKSHLSLFNNENNKAQQMMAENEQLRRKQQVAIQKVEHALATLNSMRGGHA